MIKRYLIVVAAVAALFACSNPSIIDPETPEKEDRVEAAFTVDTIRITLGESQTVKAIISWEGTAPSKDRISWSLSNKDLCTISAQEAHDSTAVTTSDSGIIVASAKVASSLEGSGKLFLKCGSEAFSCPLVVRPVQIVVPDTPEGYTNLKEPLVWNTTSAQYTESHCPDWSTSGSNTYSFGTGKGIVLPDGDFSAKGQWTTDQSSLTHTAIYITAKEGHYAVKNVWTNDGMVFTIPVYNLEAGKAFTFETCIQVTGNSPMYYSIDFSRDGKNWTVGASETYYSANNCNCRMTVDKTPVYFSAYTLDYPTSGESTMYVRLRCADGTVTQSGKTISTPVSSAAMRICGNETIKGPTVSLVDNGTSQNVDNINGTTILSGNNLCGLVSDTDGKGISGVPVTDGFHYVVTDGNGVYQMKADSQCRKVYYSLPAEYRIAHEQSSSIAKFFSDGALALNSVNRRDFVLERRTKTVEDFTLLCIGDPQVGTESDVKRYIDETMADIKSRTYEGSETVAMVLGDLVNNENTLWSPIKETMVDVPGISFYFTIGNHDLDAETTNQYDAEQMFYKTFGPVDYSFNVGKVHFVVLNDVRCTTPGSTTWNYYGGMTDAQMQWLKEDLELVKDKENKMVVFCTHIRVDTDNPQLMELLCQFEVAHLMFGHEHGRSNFVLDTYKTKSGLPPYSHVHGAACGAFWTSRINANGEPLGYDVYTIKGSRMHDWVARHQGVADSEQQIIVFDGNESYTGNAGYVYNWYQGHASNDAGVAFSVTPETQSAFVIGVWNYESTNWKVEFYRDGQKVTGVTDRGMLTNVSSSAFYVNSGHNKALYVRNFPLLTMPAIDGDPSAEKNWEVVATQTIPDSGVQHVYRCSTIHKGYDGYAK